MSIRSATLMICRSTTRSAAQLWGSTWAAVKQFFLDRIATLPGGAVSFGPVEYSVNGKVLVSKMTWRREPMTDLSYEFTIGKLLSFKAAKGGDKLALAIDPILNRGITRPR